MEEFTVNRANVDLPKDCLKQSPKGEFLVCPGCGSCYYLQDQV